MSRPPVMKFYVYSYLFMLQKKCTHLRSGDVSRDASHRKRQKKTTKLKINSISSQVTENRNCHPEYLFDFERELGFLQLRRRRAHCNTHAPSSQAISSTATREASRKYIYHSTITKMLQPITNQSIAFPIRQKSSDVFGDSNDMISLRREPTTTLSIS